jgi:Rrf2 family protein
VRLTNRSEYALLALIFLARQESPVIARAQQIPLAYLEQILRTLKRARLVQSSKGQRGGFRLARPAREISIAEIIRPLDGALAPTASVGDRFHQATPIEREAKMLAVLRGIRISITRTLEATTIAEVM